MVKLHAKGKSDKQTCSYHDKLEMIVARLQKYRICINCYQLTPRDVIQVKHPKTEPYKMPSASVIVNGF